MPRDIAIIGAGMGGLTAAIRLARRGCQVTVFEAREGAGGLASSLVVDEYRFDAGPYVLLDRPGLEWAFRQLEMELADHIQLHRIPDVYQLDVPDDQPVCIFDSLDRTAEQLDRRWPGSGARYRTFIYRMQASYARLQPLQWVARPTAFELLKTGAWRDTPLLLRSLRSVLNSTRLPDRVLQSLGIWTRIAGQTTDEAPSPLALVPSVIHSIGAYYPAGGIGVIPATLIELAKQLGVVFQFNTRVDRVVCKSGKATGIEFENGFRSADAVISNIGLGTYMKLLSPEAAAAIPAKVRAQLTKLPLQSPGICAYLAVKGNVPPPYLRFYLQDEPDGCRLLVTPGVVQPDLARNGWSPARLIVPMRHQRAETGGAVEQQNFLQRVLAESWWRQPFEEVKVLKTRLPMQWGSQFHLYCNSMNPVMTAKFMRAGRLAHRSPWIRGLYLTGSATHPGQWVSFCAVSGVLAANQLLRDVEG